jgi:hypothetical protein
MLKNELAEGFFLHPFCHLVIKAIRGDYATSRIRYLESAANQHGRASVFFPVGDLPQSPADISRQQGSQRLFNKAKRR